MVLSEYEIDAKCPLLCDFLIKCNRSTQQKSIIMKSVVCRLADQYSGVGGMGVELLN
jgi:hypothetical protein